LDTSLTKFIPETHFDSSERGSNIPMTLLSDPPSPFHMRNCISWRSLAFPRTAHMPNPQIYPLAQTIPHASPTHPPPYPLLAITSSRPSRGSGKTGKALVSRLAQRPTEACSDWAAAAERAGVGPIQGSEISNLGALLNADKELLFLG